MFLNKTTKHLEMNTSLLFRKSKDLRFATLRCFSLSSLNNQKDHYKFVVVGGGTGGLATASKCARKFGAGNVAIIEPSKNHCK